MREISNGSRKLEFPKDIIETTESEREREIDIERAREIDIEREREKSRVRSIQC